MAREKLASAAQRRARVGINRSTTHIRLKKSVKFALEKWMRKHHVRTYSQAVKRLLGQEAPP